MHRRANPKRKKGAVRKVFQWAETTLKTPWNTDQRFPIYTHPQFQLLMCEFEV